MAKCALCKEEIAPSSAAVEFAGGLFDPEDPAFFVVDEHVMKVSYTHLECLLGKLTGVKNDPE